MQFPTVCRGLAFSVFVEGSVVSPLLDCYVLYYSVTFDKEDVRQAVADRIERELGLA